MIDAKTRELVLLNLAALKGSIGVMQAQALALEQLVLGDDVAPVPGATTAPPGCPHVERENVGNFGDPQWRCARCLVATGPPEDQT